MNKVFAPIVVLFAMLSAPLFASAATEPSRDDDRYKVVWRDMPTGRGQSIRVPYVMLKDEYRQAPYAVTGKSQKPVEYRDVPTGRGQSMRVPFWMVN